MSERKKLKVKILNKEYSLLVENEELALDLAKYVNKMLDETQEELHDQPTQTIAIIAALNIAYDFHLEKSKNQDAIIEAADRLKKLKFLIANSTMLDPS